MNRNDEFWIYEADPEKDICDSRLSVDDCLDVILPELRSGLSRSAIQLAYSRILEIGCGIGRLLNEVKHRYPFADVRGTDISARFLALALLNFRGDGDPPSYHQTEWLAEALPTPVPSEWPAFDAIYSMAVFQHIENPRKRSYLLQAGGVLRPGGVMVFQYVEGDHVSRCMYDARIGDILKWCEEATLRVESVRHDLLFPRWTWVTARKVGRYG